MPEVRKRIDLSDRETISIGIMQGQPLKRIGALIGKHVSSITNEIKKYRIFIRGSCQPLTCFTPNINKAIAIIKR